MYSTRAFASRSKLFRSSIGSTSRGRSAPIAHGAIQVFVVGEVSGSDRVFVGADLGVAGVGPGVGFGDVGADPVEDFDLLELGDLELGIGEADQRDIAQRPGSGSSST